MRKLVYKYKIMRLSICNKPISFMCTMIGSFRLINHTTVKDYCTDMHMNIFVTVLYTVLCDTKVSNSELQYSVLQVSVPVDSRLMYESISKSNSHFTSYV